MKLPRRISRYDAENDLLFVDATGIKASTIEMVDAIFDELDELAEKYPGRYAMICWKDVEIGSPAVAAHYGARAAKWNTRLAGAVRYAANDPVLRSYIRTEALKHQKTGMRSNLFETYEEALQAVRDMREARKRA
ncbi:hypothetical protein [Sandaracinus amylolyticus]|uniref:hypothetical protein n=1 Tax=Sandaracinus amylolyticus TaxID=927083 RepID=UPI001F35AAEA|nr:hypothetical protein [Sandaracinus amylolyticus]UJR85906.1 Hypothetical protein I5071_79860 [Sandaracinus amylolyticus]